MEDLIAAGVNAAHSRAQRARAGKISGGLKIPGITGRRRIRSTASSPRSKLRHRRRPPSAWHHILRAPDDYAADLVSALQEVKARSGCAVAASSSPRGSSAGSARTSGGTTGCSAWSRASRISWPWKTREFKGRYHVLHGVLTARGHRAEQPGSRSCSSASRTEGGRGDRRDEPRRRGRGDGALSDEAPRRWASA